MPQPRQVSLVEQQGRSGECVGTLLLRPDLHWPSRLCQARLERLGSCRDLLPRWDRKPIHLSEAHQVIALMSKGSARHLNTPASAGAIQSVLEFLCRAHPVGGRDPPEW